VLGAQRLAAIDIEGQKAGRQDGDHFAADQAAGVFVEEPGQRRTRVSEDPGDHRQNRDDERGAAEGRERKKRVPERACFGHGVMMPGGKETVKRVCASGIIREMKRDNGDHTANGRVSHSR
jgi:hypothetical protein